MHKQHKDILRTLVTALRHRLAGTWDETGAPRRGDLDRELERLGFAPDGSITPMDALVQPTAQERRAYQAADARIAPFTTPDGRRQARAEFVERAAYTWINRLLALRTLEARELIDETLRPNPAYDGASEALYLLRHSAPARTQGPDGGWQAVLDNACAALAAALPGLFDWEDPNAALRPTAPALLDCIRILGGRLPATTYALDAVDAVFRDPDVLGWAYQFYQQEAKDRVYAKLGRGGKIESRGEIAAATQLFTEPYMVKWMLQNSLGCTYAEAYPDSRLPATWEYYIRSDESSVTSHESSVTSHESRVTHDASLVTRDSSPVTLSDLTLLDPSMGSGHILREGFDMLFAMYRERHPEMAPPEIARRILSHHLHGIDIDPRAAQLAALTLLVRAWETINNCQLSIDNFQFLTGLALNLATTPTLAPGALDRHLDRHPEDAVYRPILAGVFGALEQAHLLGSLLRPEEHLDAAITEFRRQAGGGQLALLGEGSAANRLLEELGRHDPAELKRLLLARVGRSFAREAAGGDVGGQLLGREAGEGVHLLQLLGRRYAVVCTNPPYMGSKNMDAPLKRYVEQHYKAGKRDLYAAFILRCLELCRHAGRVAMITQQSWMFLKSFTDLRAVPAEALAKAKERGDFTGLLRETCIEGLAHLGPNAFEEISGEVVQNAMFVLHRRQPFTSHRLHAFRLIGTVDSETKAQLLSSGYGTEITYTPLQMSFLSIAQSPVCYWLSDNLFSLLSKSSKIGDFIEIRQGLATADNDRFTRFHWEVTAGSAGGDGQISGRWLPYAKGGGYQKWRGLLWSLVDWEYRGQRIKSRINPDSGRPYSNVWMLADTEARFFFRSGLTYSPMARGSIGVRRLAQAVFGHAANLIIPQSGFLRLISAILNARISSYLVRSLTQKVGIELSHINALPGPPDSSIFEDCGGRYVEICEAIKERMVSGNPVEYECIPVWSVSPECKLSGGCCISEAILHTLEAMSEGLVSQMYHLEDQDLQSVIAETGIPAGWHPLISSLDATPKLPAYVQAIVDEHQLSSLLSSHDHITPTPAELARIKANLRTLYEAGPGAKADDLDLEELDHQDDDDETGAAGAYIPIPTETFLEELSVKLQIHPISVYWLLEELRSEGVRCKPEEQRLLEDRLSVLVLRLLGHRWPRQIEAGEPVPSWADTDGVIPLTPHTGEPTLADRVRARLRAEEGDLGAQRTEALLQELTGRTLAEWLRRDFFRRHVSQFKKRPIAWHLASKPRARDRGRGAKQSEPRPSGRGDPAFECLVYYHRTDTDILARIRTQYVERLLERERGAVAHARRGAAPDETAIAAATARIRELEEFAARLRQVEEQGFACAALDELLAAAPLDRWSGDGVLPPASQAGLLAQEQAWTVDINDGVRVNIAPLQAAGLLAADVLAAKDLPRAIADRARWRSDERRWVRAGKLPRCGWMPDDVPESPAWTDLAPEREKERLRLEEKRRRVVGEIGAA